MDFPGLNEFQAARVTNPSQSEIIRQSLYDHLIYAGAGQTQLSFFQAPVGQGFASALGSTAGTPKTLADTNMQLGGQLPSGMAFLIESIELSCYPGTVSTANTYTAAGMAIFTAVAATAVLARLDDVNVFFQSGLVELNILQKNYLRETPAGRFPPKSHIGANVAVSSNSATTAEVGAVNAFADGRPYYLEPRVSLQPAMNFEVIIRYPAAVAMTSGFNARIGCYLDGYLNRASQ
jgi:hypothetical protein